MKLHGCLSDCVIPQAATSFLMQPPQMRAYPSTTKKCDESAASHDSLQPGNRIDLLGPGQRRAHMPQGSQSQAADAHNLPLGWPESYACSKCASRACGRVQGSVRLPTPVVILLHPLQFSGLLRALLRGEPVVAWKGSPAGRFMEGSWRNCCLRGAGVSCDIDQLAVGLIEQAGRTASCYQDAHHPPWRRPCGEIVRSPALFSLWLVLRKGGSIRAVCSSLLQGVQLGGEVAGTGWVRLEIQARIS